MNTQPHAFNNNLNFELREYETLTDLSLKIDFLEQLYKAGELKNKKAQIFFQPFLSLDLLTQKKLENIYWECVKRLSSLRHIETIPTESERACFKLIRKKTKLKIYKSFWVKNFCLDFFIPRIQTAIEVDGNIHFNEIKMKKDNYKEKYLQSLNISVWRIQNQEVRFFISSVAPFMNSEIRKGSKAVKRTMKNIFIETIAYHSTFEDLRAFLGEDVKRAYNANCSNRNMNLHLPSNKSLKNYH